MLYTQAIESDQGIMSLFSNRAACYLKLGLWDKTISDCDIGIRMYQDLSRNLDSEVGEHIDHKIVCKLYLRKGTAFRHKNERQLAIQAFMDGFKIGFDEKLFDDEIKKTVQLTDISTTSTTTSRTQVPVTVVDQLPPELELLSKTFIPELSSSSTPPPETRATTKSTQKASSRVKASSWVSSWTTKSNEKGPITASVSGLTTSSSETKLPVVSTAPAPPTIKRAATTTNATPSSKLSVPASKTTEKEKSPLRPSALIIPSASPSSSLPPTSQRNLFIPPATLNLFTLSQLIRSSRQDLAAVYTFLFDKLDGTELVSIHKDGGIECDTLDFICDTIIAQGLNGGNSKEQWKLKTLDLVNGLGKCSRFELAKAFSSTDKANKVLDMYGDSNEKQLLQSILL